MGIISEGLHSIAVERARETSRIERIHSEVTESVSDDLLESAVTNVTMESVDDISVEDLEELLNELPADADLEKEEITRLLAIEDDDIDIDDIVGISLNVE